MILKSVMEDISSGDFTKALVTVASLLFVLFCTMPVHEYAHAWMAVKQGDDTPRLAGRLTLKPMAHLSVIGALMILIVGFGYAKPVPVNIRNLKNGKKSFALVAVAGPISNLLMALIFLFLNAIVSVLYVKSVVPMAVGQVLYNFFYYASFVNVSLAVFNLIPIPPLDGSRILTLIVPDKYYYVLLKYERYIMLGLFVLLWLNILSIPLSYLTSWTYNGLNWVATLPFRLIGWL